MKPSVTYVLFTYLIRPVRKNKPSHFKNHNNSPIFSVNFQLKLRPKRRDNYLSVLSMSFITIRKHDLSKTQIFRNFRSWYRWHDKTKPIISLVSTRNKLKCLERYDLRVGIYITGTCQDNTLWLNSLFRPVNEHASRTLNFIGPRRCLRTVVNDTTEWVTTLVSERGMSWV